MRERVGELTSLPDQDLLDLLPSRAVEQEVLDMLDESAPGDVCLVDTAK